MCTLALRRLSSCNGQLSAAGACSDRNCIVALSEAALAASSCTAVQGFANIPTAADLGCNADGSVMAAAGEPTGANAH
jgi:hypothetical protein